MADFFQYRNGRLFCEDIPVDQLADAYGTPLLVYSRRTLVAHAKSFADAFADLDPLICFSVKSCWNIHLLRILTDLDYGLDVVSGGELYRASLTNVSPENIVFAGVAKTDREIELALDMNIGLLNVESEQELANIGRLAGRAGKSVSATLRVNPNVFDQQTPEQTATGRGDSKFGVPIEHAISVFEKARALKGVQLRGLHIHLGSPIPSPDTYRRTITQILQLKAKLADLGFAIEILDIGGGFPASYDRNVPAPSWSSYADVIMPELRPFVEQGGKVVMEPGRTISANAGILLTEVQYTKKKDAMSFALVDVGMNHLIRPTLYGSEHTILPTIEKEGPLEPYTVAGPICESSDFIAKKRMLPRLERGNRLAAFSCGAYVMVMASQYNSQPRPPEILVDGKEAQIIRQRETYQDIVEPELAAQEAPTMKKSTGTGA